MKKLSLSKRTISSLTHLESASIKGGSDITCPIPTDPADTCIMTVCTGHNTVTVPPPAPTYSCTCVGYYTGPLTGTYASHETCNTDNCLTYQQATGCTAETVVICE